MRYNSADAPIGAGQERIVTLSSWLVACTGTPETPPAPAPVVAPVPAPAPAEPARPTPEAELDACLASEAARTPEGSVACADAAIARWEEERSRSHEALLAALPDEQDPLLLASDQAWVTFRDAELAAIGAVSAQRGGANALELAFDRLGLVRDRARRLARYTAALAGEPELPELKHHPIDEALQDCLRGPGPKLPCVEEAIAKSEKALSAGGDALVGELSSPAPATAAQAAWQSYRAAETALVTAAYSDPAYAARERHDLVRSRSEQVDDYLVRIRERGEP
jgi:uncharacterized protein YecT (DUF1311 family)